MSGILGIWNTDGAPVSEALLLEMSSLLAHRGPDSSSHLLCGNAGFAFHQLKVTPESMAEKQPLRSTSGAVVLWDGRLDNRAELLKELRPSHPVNESSPDVELVAAAYDEFKSGFASKLDGDFVAAVYDASDQILLLGRDVIGTRALNYCRFGPYVLFASEIKALLTHPAVKTSPNKDSFAEFLFRLWDYREESNTFFTNISTVPAGRLITITPERTVSDKHFEFDTRRTIRFRTQEQYVEAYFEKFTRAVRNRLRSMSPAAILVSGGLDSSSIFCVADSLSRFGRVAPFFGIGQVGADPRSDELIFQQAVEEKCGRPIIKQHVSRFTCLQDAQAKIWHTEGLLLMADDWAELFRECNRRGARVLLSGFFGDNLLANPAYIFDLLARGKWIAAYECARGYCGNAWFPAEEFQIPRRELVMDLLLNLKGYLIPESLRPAYHRLRRALFRSEYQSPFYSTSFHSDFQAFAARSRRMRMRGSRAHAKALYHHAMSKSYKGRLERDAKSNAQFQLETTYPFFDRELISLVMAMPGEVICPKGVSRGIHREAMKGTLPEMVRNRRTKGDFVRVGRLGALQDFDRLTEWLIEGEAMRHDFLKPEAELRADLAELKASLQDESDASGYAFWKTWDLLEIEQFLRVFFSGS